MSEEQILLSVISIVALTAIYFWRITIPLAIFGGLLAVGPVGWVILIVIAIVIS